MPELPMRCPAPLIASLDGFAAKMKRVLMPGLWPSVLNMVRCAPLVRSIGKRPASLAANPKRRVDHR